MVPPESVILPVDIVIVPSIVATSVTVKSSVVVNCSAVTVPDAVTFPVTVCVPLASVPLVDTFSSPKDIDPPESVIDPFARVNYQLLNLLQVWLHPHLKFPLWKHSHLQKISTLQNRLYYHLQELDCQLLYQ